MHQIKEAAKAQILGQTDLHLAEFKRTSRAPPRRLPEDELSYSIHQDKLNYKRTTPCYMRLGKRHKA